MTALVLTIGLVAVLAVSGGSRKTTPPDIQISNEVDVIDTPVETMSESEQAIKVYVKEDAHVKEENQTKNYGAEKFLVSDGSPVSYVYMKFDLTNITAANLNSAKLKITPLLSRKVDKVIKVVADSNWSENTINWKTKPALGATLASLKQEVKEGSSLEIPLDASQLKPYAGKNVTIAIIDNAEGYQLKFYSKNTLSSAVQLLLSGTGTPIPTGSLTPTQTPTKNPTKVPSVTITPVTGTPTVRPSATPTPRVTQTPTPTPATTIVPTGNPTTYPSVPPVPVGQGIWISQAEIMALPTPTDSQSWNNLKAAASKSTESPNIENQDDNTNVYVLAKALVYARTGEPQYKNDVVAALRVVANWPKYGDRALALGREIGAYPIAADIINLKVVDPALDAQFRTRISQLRTEATSGGPTSLINCHEKRPNNWGLHCGASRMAIDAYLGDKVDLQKAADVYRAWTGENKTYHRCTKNGVSSTCFDFGDLSWQCNPSDPVGVNPAGCMRNGFDLGGIPNDDQRRCGGFGVPPCHTGYYWGAVEGPVVMSIILERQGYKDVWNWGNRAVYRIAERSLAWEKTYRKSEDDASYWAEGDDVWETWVINYGYGSNFPTSAVNADNPGKNMSWADWTHATRK